MRLKGFKCDRCGKVVAGEDCWNITDDEAGGQFIDDFNLQDLELCKDCYDRFCQGMRNYVAEFISCFGSNHICGCKEVEE